MSDSHASGACPACGVELPPGFPGASLTCACGHRTLVPPSLSSGRLSTTSSGVPSGHAPHSGPSSARSEGPYRSAAVGASELEPTAMCPYCGNECPAMVRICPHCDVRLENVRCQRCFSLQAPGSFACNRCGRALELEPLLDATDAPCPRCNHPLEGSPAADARIHECPRCGGMFVPRDVLVEILCSAEIGGALRDGPVTDPSSHPRFARTPQRDPTGGWTVESGSARMLDEVRYVPCPLCHASMNRVNFGRVSGVIVDVCKLHGTWFDAGELTRVVAFAASGGLDKTRAREQEEKHDVKARAAEVRVTFASIEPHVSSRERFGLWHDFLRALFD